MNIVRENIGKLNDVLTVKVAANDYMEAVGKSLKELRRKANIPGFRVGHVPMGMIERQYKSSVTIDEVSKLVNAEMEKYLKEQDVHVLFEPMALPEKTEGDFEHPDTFSFSFEIGIRPEIKVDYAKAKEVVYRKIQASESEIDSNVKGVRRRFGKFSSTETVVDEDLVLGLIPSDKEGEESQNTSFLTTYLNEEGKTLVLGKKLHDVLELDTTKVFRSDYERSTFLKCKVEELETAPTNVKFEITAIHHTEPAELNEEFFERAFPNGEVKTEAQMRDHFKAQIELSYASQEKMQYRGEAMQALLEGVQIELPDAFVKKYMIANDPNYTAENIEEKYPDLQKSLSFQLMESVIAAEGNVQIEYTDVIAYIRNYIAASYLGAPYQSLDNATQQQVDKLAESMLKQERMVNNAYENIYFERVTDLIREKANAKVVEVSMDEFFGATAESEPKAKKSRAKKTTAKKEEAVEKDAEDAAEKPAKKPAAKKATKKSSKE